MKKQSLYLLFSAVFFTAISCTDHEIDVISETDRQFMISAADGNLFEVKSGEMAMAKALLDPVKGFGIHMVNDHSKAMEEMKALASKKMVDLPATLSLPKQLKLDSLSARSGMDFDKLYMTMMVASHVETIKLFEMEVANGKNEEVKSFAAGKLPTLKHHLEDATALKNSL